MYLRYVYTYIYIYTNICIYICEIYLQHFLLESEVRRHFCKSYTASTCWMHTTSVVQFWYCLKSDDTYREKETGQGYGKFYDPCPSLSAIVLNLM